MNIDPIFCSLLQNRRIQVMKMSSQPLTIEVFLSDRVEEYTPHKSTDPNLTRPSISVVIPVFNSAGTLESLVSRLVPVLS
jgi:hypothetical protein